jgi:hypothetical protein
MMDEQRLYDDCIGLDAHLEWIFTRTSKLKDENKDTLLVAFPLKIYPMIFTKFHQSSYMAMYTITG